MKYYQEPQKNIPVIETDVFVAGAGTAGCIAAMAAAKAGARVLLVEKLPIPTGTLGNGGNCLYSFYNTCTDPDKAVRIVGGLPYEFYLRCVEEGVAYNLIPTPNSAHAVPFLAYPNREGVKGVLCMMLEEYGVETLLQTMLVDVVKNEGGIEYALIENKDGRYAVKAGSYIDCTGDADIAAKAGAGITHNWEIYDQVCGGPTSLPFALGGVDFEKTLREAPDVFQRIVIKDDEDGYLQKYRLRHTLNPERCPNLCKMDIRSFTTLMSFAPGEASAINNSKGPMTDASSCENLTKAEMSERIKIVKFVQALRKDLPGFENCHLIWEAVQLGIRSSRIVVCEKMLTEKEVSSATRFEKEIGLYGFQDMVEKVPSTKIQDPGFYGLPYQMIVPEGIANLYVAGRCVTKELMAHNSTRNTVSCMVMGQAAGVAAALCAGKGYDNGTLPYETLREALLKQGVILDV